MFGSVFYVLGTSLSLVIGLLVVVRNPRNRINILYGITSLLLLLYQTANYVSLTSKNPLWLIRASLFFCVLAVLSLYYFVDLVIRHRAKYTLINPITVLTIMIAFLMLTPWVVVGVNTTPVISPITTPLMLLFVISFIGLLFAACRILITTRSSDKNNKQAIPILIGILPIAILSPITGVIAPTILKKPQLLHLNSLYILFFVLTVGYVIVRHKLFDIRLVVARSMGYLLSIIFLGAIYGFLAFNIISDLIFSGSNTTLWQKTVYTLLAITIAFTFQPLKRFFDRLSNKLFYKDAYDSQELLDNFNRFLVTTIDIDKLLKNSAEIINQSIKAEYIMFGVKQVEGLPQRIIGTKNKQFTQEDIEKVRKVTPMMRQKSIIVDDLDESQVKLKALLTKNDVAALIRLTDTPDKNQEGIGYIVLGSKKSGSPYSRQDLQILEIIADILVIAIQNALRFEEIQNFNITLQDKVDDATKKLRRANQRLIELDQTKDDFISMASHQLRTPLTTIKGYLSMVMEGDAGKVTNKQVELLDQAFIGSQRMVYLIADLLNVSRLRTGKFVIDYKQTNLADVIESEIAQLIETAKGRNLKLVYNKPKNFPVLMLDEVKTRQVIMNFIDNAIYYTPSGGHISVSLTDLGESIEFVVTDDGIGVPKAEQQQLFNKFYRANNAKKARPDGTGLGLFMAKKVIVAQGGSIIYKTQENKGSSFGFNFVKKPLMPDNFKGVIK